MTPVASILPGARAGDPLSLARALVRIPSVNPELEPGGAGEGEVAAFCNDLMQDWGLRPELEEVAPGRMNVMGRLPGSGGTLLLNGHLDTVGVAGMTVDPFGGEIRDGRLIGRGACDMKGGVAALLAATHALSRRPERDRPTVIVALTADEEDASLGMQAVIERGVSADLAIVCEPTDLSVMPAHKGFVWVRVVFEGRAAHGSRPDLGIDAVRHAASYLAALDELETLLEAHPGHPLLGRPSFHAGTIRGGSAPSVYPDRCELVLERRTLPGETPKETVAPFLEALERLVAQSPQVKATLEVPLERPGTEVAPEAPVVQRLLRAIEAQGHPPVVRGMTAWVDAAFLNRAGIPSVCFGPGSLDQAHTADEWIEADQIRACAEILERVALDLVR